MLNAMCVCLHAQHLGLECVGVQEFWFNFIPWDIYATYKPNQRYLLLYNLNVLWEIIFWDFVILCVFSMQVENISFLSLLSICKQCRHANSVAKRIDKHKYCYLIKCYRFVAVLLIAVYWLQISFIFQLSDSKQWNGMKQSRWMQYLDVCYPNACILRL